MFLMSRPLVTFLTTLVLSFSFVLERGGPSQPSDVTDVIPEYHIIAPRTVFSSSDQVESCSDEAINPDCDDSPIWDGPVLTKQLGRIVGPSGHETFYNLPMTGVINKMRNLGYSEEEYPYWLRDDGVKMFGDYVICAANLEIFPRGTLVPSSLGMAIVCDTGAFAAVNQTQLDIAVDW